MALRSILLFCAACASAEPAPAGDGAGTSSPPGDSAAPDSGPPDDTDPPDTDEPWDTGVEDAGGFDWAEEEDAGGGEPVDTSWLFNRDTIHEINLKIPAAGRNALGTSPYEYTKAKVRIDGILVEDVGVRLRGKIGSFRELDSKPKFKISFDAFVDDQRFYGLEAIDLNNSIVDCSYLREQLGYRVFEIAGIAAPRTGFVNLTINDAHYGLYTLIEVPDRRWLEEFQADASGNLYDGKYIWYGGWSYTLLDFDDNRWSLYELEEGTDVANADVWAVADARSRSVGTQNFYTTTEPYVDWDQVLMFWAVEEWIAQLDGYFNNTNNNRVYFDPANGGRMQFVPWDLDYAFYADGSWGRNWNTPLGLLGVACLQDANCLAARNQAMNELLALIDTADLLNELEEWDQLTRNDAANDPRTTCGVSGVDSYRSTLKNWVPGRAATIRARWGL